MNLVPIPLCSNLGCKGRCLVAVIGPKFHSLAKKSSRIVMYVYHLKKGHTTCTFFYVSIREGPVIYDPLVWPPGFSVAPLLLF